MPGLATNQPQSKSWRREQLGWLKPGSPDPIWHRKQAPDWRPRAATVPPQALESAPKP